MTTTIDAFRRSIVDQRIPLLKKHVAFALWNDVTRGNPVDTGRSRAAWNVSSGSADLSVPAEAPKGGKVPAAPPPRIGQIPVGVPVIVSNNVPYITALEKGHSQQAPNGFVRAALDRLLRRFDGLVRQVKALGER